MGLNMDVREIILEIIRKHGTHGFVPCATEIENIILMFIDWLVKEVTVKMKWQDGIGYVKQWSYDPDGWQKSRSPYYTWTTSELFIYWYEKIYEK
jgi:hypothetical protein